MTVSNEFERYINAMSDFHLDHLQSIGITGKAIVNVGLIGIGKIEIEGPYWYPEECGKPALIMPVGDNNRFSSIVDLVALHTSQPDDWWLRTGLSPVLGYRNIENSIYFETQLTVHRNPLQWLQSECDGICILDWKGCHLPLWLSNVKNVICPDLATGDRLSKALDRNIALPQIRIGRSQHAA